MSDWRAGCTIARRIGENDPLLNSRYGETMAARQRDYSITVPHSCRLFHRQWFAGRNVLAFLRVPEVEAAIRPDGHEGLAVRSKRERGIAVSRCDSVDET